MEPLADDDFLIRDYITKEGIKVGFEGSSPHISNLTYLNVVLINK